MSPANPPKGAAEACFSSSGLLRYRGAGRKMPQRASHTLPSGIFGKQGFMEIALSL
jgi:hypothetical protein